MNKCITNTLFKLNSSKRMFNFLFVAVLCSVLFSTPPDSRNEVTALSINRQSALRAEGFFSHSLHRNDKSEKGRNNCLRLQLLAFFEFLFILVH